MKGTVHVKFLLINWNLLEPHQHIHMFTDFIVIKTKQKSNIFEPDNIFSYSDHWLGIWHWPLLLQEELKKQMFGKTLPERLTIFEKLLTSNNGGDGYFVGDKVSYFEMIYDFTLYLKGEYTQYIKCENCCL